MPTNMRIWPISQPACPSCARRLKRDLARPGLPREKILAAIVTLLEETLIRIGNEDYARTNHSFGLTTLRNRHVQVKGEELRFLFNGQERQDNGVCRCTTGGWRG